MCVKEMPEKHSCLRTAMAFAGEMATALQQLDLHARCYQTFSKPHAPEVIYFGI